MSSGFFPEDRPSRRRAIKNKKGGPLGPPRFALGSYLAPESKITYLGLLMLSDFDLSDLSGVLAEATFR